MRQRILGSHTPPCHRFEGGGEVRHCDPKTGSVHSTIGSLHCAVHYSVVQVGFFFAQIKMSWRSLLTSQYST